MLTRHYLVQSKLNPPRVNRRILKRERITRLLLEALEYRLTIVQAGPGYGKSTSLAALVETTTPLAWYHLSSEDADPFTFFLHLAHTLKPHLVSAEPLFTHLEEQGSHPSGVNWTLLADELANLLTQSLETNLLLILDDFHQANQSKEVIAIVDRLVDHSPSNLHFILSTRNPIKLAGYLNLKVRGQVLLIDQNDLSFTPQEITALFHNHYALALTQEEIAALADETEGWAIALQLFWQSFKTGAVNPLRHKPEPGHLQEEELFAFLAHEVMARLSPDVQAFLRTTSVLRDLNAEVCNYLRMETDSDQYIKYLLENGLFVVDLGGESIRYHHLFREFILKLLPQELVIANHKKAAEYYLQVGLHESAIYHLLKAEDSPRAADIISKIGESLILSGRIETLNKWITSIDPEVLESYPLLLCFLGDFARLHSRFDEALGWYHQAEERSKLSGDIQVTSQALYGQAKVYLDTVNPSQAERLLQEALQLVDGKADRENRARLLELLAENKLNSGQLEQSQFYRKQARDLRDIGHGEMELSVRVLLRTGKLEQARRILMDRKEVEKHEPFPTSRSHRETLLLLALILEFQGDWELAYQYAREGITRGEQLQSPFIVAVGRMRQGHAALLNPDEFGFREAIDCYQYAIQVADILSVPRLKVEALWGLCRAYGFSGDLQLAEQAAMEGIRQGALAGDEWISALILVSMGAGFALAEKYTPALEWIERARDKFNKVSDLYGETIARLWQCYIWWKINQTVRLDKGLDECLAMIRDNEYEFILTQRTLIGHPQPRSILPMLLYARDKGIQKPYIETILFSLGLSSLKSHPGYQLRVQMFGSFRVWRGSHEIPPGAWQREKARHLFQLLVMNSPAALERDQLVEFLWRNADADQGRRNFRVTLSTLLRVLVPDHAREDDSTFIGREGSMYFLRSDADIWVDVKEFERLILQAENQDASQKEVKFKLFHKALKLYKGDFLQDNLYEEWASRERERLLNLYLRTAEALASLYAERLDWSRVIELCQTILSRDPCWESAYRMTMSAYMALGNKPAAFRTYHKCVETLNNELGIKPSITSQKLYEKLFPNPPVF